jgi:hypothetical protein
MKKINGSLWHFQSSQQSKKKHFKNYFCIALLKINDQIRPIASLKLVMMVVYRCFFFIHSNDLLSKKAKKAFLCNNYL